MGYNLTENLFGYTLVQDILVESATTSVTFSGLNYTAADDLLLVSDILTSGGTVDYGLYVNNNMTNSNYYRQYLNSDGTSVGSGRDNIPFFMYVTSENRTLGITKIKLTNSGYFISQTDNSRQYSGSSICLTNYNTTSTFTLSSINSLTVANTGTINCIGATSRFRLYKLNATKVADITVGTATTSVDITGLNITKDSEYMLVSDVVNANSNSWNSIYFNGNTTPTNYYIQLLNANGTTVDSSRENTSNFNYNPTTNKNLIYSNIKLTNNGNIVGQLNNARMYGGSSLSIANYALTSTFTATSISQITIQSNGTNGIGIGSRFQLYRMKG